MIRIVQRNGYRCIAQRLSVLCAGKDDILHAPAPKLLYPLFTENPAYRIGNVALAAAVRADDAGYSVVEVEFDFVGKRLKALYLNAF